MTDTENQIHLVDNDFLIKLARWDLLEEFLAAFGATPRHIRAIFTLRRRLFANGNANLSLCGTPSAARRLDQFLLNSSTATPVDFDFVAAATGLNSLDAGEVTLLGALCAGGGNYFYTGDKRAIKALTALNGSQFEEKYKGKIICLEQALLFMIGKLGFGSIRDKLCSDPDADPGIADLLVGGAQTSTEAFCAGLRIKVDRLQADCGGLLRTA